MTSVLPLEPFTFPLKGQQLIEASAGTGKTYTITALYLRLLLGQGDISDKPLGPDQILVVTFTEAATEELRDRIRSRIVDARNAFLLPDVSDPFLDQLKQNTADHEQAIKLLEQAIRQMDEAAIFTIHGFCQRMLKQHAFESGSLFESELTQDDQSLIRSAAIDFWRNTIYPLSGPLSSLVMRYWSSPESLMMEIRGLLSRSVRVTPDLSDQDLAEAYDARLEALNEFKQAWLQNEDDLVTLVQSSGVNKRSYTKANLPKWIAQIDDYAASEQLEPNKKLVTTLQKFTSSVLQEKTPEGAEFPQHYLFEQLETLLEGAVPVKEILLSRALKEVRQRLARAKKQYQVQTFDDLLIDLHQALYSNSGESLAGAICDQFPVAMIDEFQDTDPLQYGIFSTLYKDVNRHALIMIGDPKQAIYAFRGADIFTYIQARRQVPQTFTLETNWRSTTSMVEGVNHLFQSADSAFIYDEDIPFIPVKAADKAGKRLKIQNVEPPALTLWHQESDEPLNNAQYLATYAQATASEIDRLLSGNTLIGDRKLQGSDIAVLVRDRFEAEEIRRALAVYEHPCVYLSNKDSVFKSQEAIELSLLLTAIENPLNDRALKAALATEFMQLDMHDLDRLNHDELGWEKVITEFSDYREIWLRLGVLPMLSRLIHQRNLAAMTLEQVSGERRLTNMLHLAELLQQASAEREGVAGLIRWFNEQISQPSGGGDEQILRLESERNLVTIVTVHKSKGLEYPVVFLPFACRFKEQKSAFYHDESGEAVLDLKAEPEALKEADKERLAEELRLLYVALTRAVYSCYIGISHIKIGNSKKSRLIDSALGFLLLQSGIELDEALQTLEQPAAIQVLTPPNYGSQKDLFAVEEEQTAQLEARNFQRKIDRDWRVSSYSALSTHQASHIPELPGLDLEVAAEGQEQVEEVIPDEDNIFTFPRGANAGTFLHSVFEEISFARYQQVMLESDEYRTQLHDQLQVAGYEERWQCVIEKLIEDVLATDLNGQGLRLNQINDEDRLVEMEFMLSAEHITVGRLESLIRRYDPLAAKAKPLSFEPLRGLLKGFIDLLFRDGEKYYVLDYKSNHLGYEASSYTQEAIKESMIDHRYDLQYLLYTLAVHRLLKQRIPDYDYERHFGGVYYLFLRGMDGESTNGVFHDKPDIELIEKLDLMFAGEVVDV
ncbi:exodeoxyribonuclease V subunit beta [Neptuniibacter sp. QD29_5]|uniref:exodeoxyribonuclease V subunit beta n=1 Tax=Neptuniibacter sp. QD29_5 TaxID=3398207 RepID=UPI0039F5DE89